MTPAWWVYVLLCRGGTLYTGIARDPDERFRRHRSGRGAAYTRINPPVALLARKGCPDRRAALREEAALRRLPRPKKMDWVREHGPGPNPLPGGGPEQGG